MSRVRTRPTREETRARLFEAAAAVFEERGIGGASIAMITEAAGLTRGAFYSNFDNKDELIIAMIEDHVEQSSRRHLQLAEKHSNPVDFVSALRAVDRSEQDPLGRSPLLHIELILYEARAEEHRPELAKRLRARRAMVAEVIAANDSGSDGPGFGEPKWAALLLALEDGFRLHRLIDPDTTPADSFLRAVNELQQAVGIASSEPS